MLAAFDISIVVLVLGLADLAFSRSGLTELANLSLLKGVLLAGTGPVLAVFLNYILPSSVKDSIVFWRLKDALPGHRAFSQHMKGDPRVDVFALKEKIGELPQSPRDQNATWYRLSHKYRSNVSVVDAHKRFLLSAILQV